MKLIKTEECPICKMETGLVSKSGFKYNKSYVCRNCAKKLTALGITIFNIKKYTIDELRLKIGISSNIEEKSKIEINQFNAERKIGNYIYFDNTNKKFAFPVKIMNGLINDLTVYSYYEILDYELLEDGNTVCNGGIGKALIGGAILGRTGAIIASNSSRKQKEICTNLQIKITLNNIAIPVVYINIITTKVKKDSSLYKKQYSTAQEILSILNIICTPDKAEINNKVNLDSTFSSADEIIKYKQLLDNGIISQAEFDQKKEQLLKL